MANSENQVIVGSSITNLCKLNQNCDDKQLFMLSESHVLAKSKAIFKIGI